MAFNALGTLPDSPANTAQSASAMPVQPKQTDTKRSTKSSLPRAAKRLMTSAQSLHSPPYSEETNANAQLIQAVKSLSDSVKGLESKMAIFENALQAQLYLNFLQAHKPGSK